MPYESFWQAGANVTGFYDQSTSYAPGYCVVGTYAEVRVVVDDSNGASVPVSTEFLRDD